ncbi:hypothetical protein Pan44_33190 [Caulifigura coniformis]|uniref:Uncharacterized protein n=1 Tax=Caulifigura coniformis TaxID=2527983 RepID=A0A517SGM4_9PLAN|nr:hypothetical protein [Caulifigura coniformis]QDT55276.1 hypothetical protein Pan44_33190 [Caulifigura coniformis]
MTAETAKPNRKRWRWIIAGVLLFVVALATAWYWPGVDQRFLGTWSFSIGPTISVRWTFHDDGRLDIWRKSGALEDTTHERWFVSGRRFYHVPDQSRRDHVVNSVARWWAILNDRAIPLKIVIDEVGADRIRLRQVFPGPFDESHVMTLTRVAE